MPLGALFFDFATINYYNSDMKSLPYIEDYIVLMADHYLSWPPTAPVINLARYDDPIVNSMADQIQRGVGFTDKQALLAHKIVTKYKRQWITAGYDISRHEDDAVFRLPIRVIDRSHSIDINNNRIEIKFPYNQDMISHVRAAINEYPGQLYFDKENRCWVTSVIEPRLKWCREFGTKYNFEFGAEFQQACQQMNAITAHDIMLRYNGSEFEITNAADSLVDYVHEHGGFDEQNIIRLIDLSGICGYQVDNTVYQQLDIDCDQDLIRMLTERSTNLIYDTQIDLTGVIRYAELTQRFPIYVYESGSSVMRQQLNRYFTVEDIVDRKSTPNSARGGRVVYFNHWKLADTNIPLLVTTHTLMIGNRRQQMLHSADKVVFFSQRIEDDQVPVTN